MSDGEQKNPQPLTESRTLFSETSLAYAMRVWTASGEESDHNNAAFWPHPSEGIGE